MDLQLQLDEQVRLLQDSLDKLPKTGNDFAEAERDYKVILRKEVIKLREQGEAIGVISLICYGIPSVAEARFKRDVAQTLYEANQEAINTYKLKIRLIESQIGREWNNESRR